MSLTFGAFASTIPAMKRYIPIILISLLAIILHVWWATYTRYTAEDSHITYQFAKQIANGNGFVFNKGEPIYGTTTPLLTLLLALCYYISPNLALTSKVIGLSAYICGLCFLYFSIPYRRAAILACSILAISSKLIAESMQGMETPLLFLFMMGAYFGYTKDRPYLSGIMCGLLLWTRIDSIVYVSALFLSFLFFGTLGRLWTSTVKFSIGTFVYVPWLVFATLYFGSPIPYTITAKIVAYGIGNPPIATHFLRIIDYISWPVFLLTVLSVLYVGKRNLFLALFFTANILILAKTGSTFEYRYFYTITIVSIVMVCLMVTRIRDGLWKICIVALLLYGSFNQVKPVTWYRDYQVKRLNVLRDMGVWLKENAPEDSKVLMVDVGYTPYYADRYTFDEVGLITPKVVALRKAGVTGNELYIYLRPDYIILQCTQPLRDEFERYYERVMKFDNGYARACYDVWKMK